MQPELQNQQLNQQLPQTNAAIPNIPQQSAVNTTMQDLLLHQPRISHQKIKNRVDQSAPKILSCFLKCVKI